MLTHDKYLVGGASFSEWSVFISKSFYTSFVNGADLSAIITALACIESFFRTEDPSSKNKKLYELINECTFLNDEEKNNLHCLRQFRNQWVHLDDCDDSSIIKNEGYYEKECENMAFLSVEVLFAVLFSNPFI